MLSLGLLSIGLLSVVALLGVRALLRGGGTRAKRRRVVIVGAGGEARTLSRVMQRFGAGSYEIVGFVDDLLRARSRSPSLPDLRFLGRVKDLHKIIKEHDIDELVVALAGHPDKDVFHALLGCWMSGVQVKTAPMIHGELTGRLPGDHCDYGWYLWLLIENRSAVGEAFLKRAFDVIISVVGLFVLVLLLPVLAVVIRLDSPGRVFYKQTRIGRNGRPFELVKLRTMVPDAEPDGIPRWATIDDERVTRVGRVLRFTMLDEVPQLFNVLKGEMSLVGPRPERPEIAAQLAARLPLYQMRHCVRPGMAGWAFIQQGYARTLDEAAVKLQYDLNYIWSRSTAGDAAILVNSVLASLTMRRKERIGALPGASVTPLSEISETEGTVALLRTGSSTADISSTGLLTRSGR